MWFMYICVHTYIYLSSPVKSRHCCLCIRNQVLDNMLVSLTYAKFHCQTVANSFMICTTMADKRERKQQQQHAHTHMSFPVVTEFSFTSHMCSILHVQFLCVFLWLFLALFFFFIRSCSCFWCCYSSSSYFCFPQMLYDKISSHFLYHFNIHMTSSLTVYVILERVLQLKHRMRIDFDSNIQYIYVCMCVCIHITCISLAASYKHLLIFSCFVFGIW